MWSKPNYIELDRKAVMAKINAKAWTVGEAMSYEELAALGEGGVGVIYLPEGTYEEAMVQSVDLIMNTVTFIVRGVKRVWDRITNVFT